MAQEMKTYTVKVEIEVEVLAENEAFAKIRGAEVASRRIMRSNNVDTPNLTIEVNRKK